MKERLTILVVGGYGTFGGRLVRRVGDDPRLTLLVAGRSAEKATEFCRLFSAAARLRPVAFDREGDVAAQIDSLRPDLLIDATGPFQTYGGEPYRLVRACIEAGVDYLDLADGAEFVAGIATFDEAARQRGVVALSGVSTCPALTGAILRHLATHLCRVDAVTAGIAPSPRATVGFSVIKAIASYGGRPVKIRQGGRPATDYALLRLRRFTIAPPGALPLREKLFGLVEVPDPLVLPALRPELADIWFGAALSPSFRMRILSGLALLVWCGLLPSLQRLAPLFHRASRVMSWGEHRGGLFVEVAGADETGGAAKATFHLVAEGDDGPSIPCMAAVAIIRRLLSGRAPPPGARPATDALDLSDFEAIFATHAIATGIRTTNRSAASLPLYRRVLGEAWDKLPATIRAMHETSEIAEGRASVERGSHPLAWLAATLVGLPARAADIPVTVTFDRAAGGEIWHRRFGQNGFRSHHSEGTGGNQHLVVERFGPLAFALAPIVTGGRLALPVRRWSVLGVPMPYRLAPVSRTYEAEVDGRFTFDVDLSYPWIGRIVRYRGWLVPKGASNR